MPSPPLLPDVFLGGIDVMPLKFKRNTECLECDARDYCARCLVRNYNESGGDMFAINHHFCDVARLNERLVEEFREKGLLTQNDH